MWWSAVLCTIAINSSGRALQTLGQTEAVCKILVPPKATSGFQCWRSSHRRHQACVDFGLGAGFSFFLINGGNVLGNCIVLGEDMKDPAVLSNARLSCYPV